MANLPVELEALKARFEKSNSKPTVKDFQALIGVTPATVRIAGLGQRGLRWTVVSVSEKTGQVKVSSTDAKGNLAEISVIYTDLAIAPCSDSRRRG